MPTVVFSAGDGAKYAYVWVSQIEGVKGVVDITAMTHAVHVGKLKQCLYVTRGDTEYIVVLFPAKTQASDVKTKMRTAFKCTESQLEFLQWESLDAFHLELFGWSVPQPEETFAQFNRATDTETQKIVVPGLRTLPDEEIADFGADFMRDVVAEHLGLRALQDCKHDAMARYDSQSGNNFLYEDGALVRRACSKCYCELEEHRGCADCSRVWCISCGAQEQTRVTNAGFARKVAKRLKREQLTVASTTAYPCKDFPLEVVTKSKMKRARKLQWMLHTAPHLQPSLEGLLEFYKVFLSLFRHCYFSKHECWGKAKALFEEWSHFKVPLLGSKSWDVPDLKVQLEALRDGIEVLTCRCGNLITDGQALCAECRRPSKCRNCKQNFCTRGGDKEFADDAWGRVLRRMKRPADQMMYVIHGVCPACVSNHAPCMSQPPLKRARC